MSRSSEVRAVGHFSHNLFDHERYPDQSEYLDLSPIKRSVARCHEVMNVWRYEEWAGNLRMSRATETVPERVQSRVHTTEPTGPVPEPFHCDHIARWSARSGLGTDNTDEILIVLIMSLRHVETASQFHHQSN